MIKYFIWVFFTSKRKRERDTDILAWMLDRSVVERELSVKLLIYIPISGHELWVGTERIRFQIQGVKMSFLWEVSGLGLRDRLQSLVIQEVLSVEPLLFFMKGASWGGSVIWAGCLMHPPRSGESGVKYQGETLGRLRTHWCLLGLFQYCILGSEAGSARGFILLTASFSFPLFPSACLFDLWGFLCVTVLSSPYTIKCLESVVVAIWLIMSLHLAIQWLPGELDLSDCECKVWSIHLLPSALHVWGWGAEVVGGMAALWRKVWGCFLEVGLSSAWEKQNLCYTLLLRLLNTIIDTNNSIV